MHVVAIKKIRGGEGQFCLQSKGKHGEVPQWRKRKNSALTFEEEKTARSALDMGARPGVVHVALTNKELGRLKEAGDELERARMDGGGLNQRCELLLYTPHMYMHTYLTSCCIQMYPTCI